MSNRVDFFQSEQTTPAIPCATVSVFLEGRLCPELELTEIVRGDWPEFSWARLSYNPAGSFGEAAGAEEVESLFAMGRRICIRQVYNGTAPAPAAFGIAIFAGQIENIESRLGPDGERVEIVVRDFSSILERVSVYGQWVSSDDEPIVFFGSRRCAFNEGGRPNATVEQVEHNGNRCRLFCVEPSAGKSWSYAEVIEYLFCEYLPQGQLARPSIEQLRVLTEGREVYDLDVTDLSLLAALRRCCEKTGLSIRFMPRLTASGPEQAIELYRPGCGRAVELSCQAKGEQLSISKTNIARVHSRKNFWPVTHRHIGQGDFKVYEATFDLIKAWDPAYEDPEKYEKFSPSTNPDFYQVKNVYRKWCLNEAGDYSCSPYNQGEAFDFSRIFAGDFVRRHRRFWPALTTDRQNRSLGYYLQVSFDNGENWWQYAYSFDNLAEECGVWLSSDKLDADTWTAACYERLKFRMTVSVVSDQRLRFTVADGPVGSVAPVVEHIITLGRQFKYRKVSSQSIFFKSSDDSIGPPDEVDDTKGLYEFVRKRAAGSAEIIETVDVQTPYLTFDYRVGDIVRTSPESRDLLGCRGDNRSSRRIKWVQMDFAGQCTNLKIIRQRAAV